MTADLTQYVKNAGHSLIRLNAKHAGSASQPTSIYDMREGPEHKSLSARQEYLTSPAITPVRKTLATFGHARLKREIVKLLRDNVRDGGIGSILRKDLQRKLAAALKRDHALTKVERKEIEKRLSNAVAALRKQFDPPLQPDRGDRRIRLVKVAVARPFR